MIKSFKRFVKDGVPKVALVIYHFSSSDSLSRTVLDKLLKEAKQKVDLGQGRLIYYHKAHIPGGQAHLHFHAREGELYSLNKNGKAHDQSHGKKMHRWAMDGVKAHYPGFQLPAKGLIEQLFADTSSKMLTESFGSANPVIVSPDTMEEAEELARTSS